jgi:hypothetical protein
MPPGMVTTSVFGLFAGIFTFCVKWPLEKFEPPPQKNFSQPFNHEFFCHPPFLITIKYNSTAKFSFGRFFLFSITKVSVSPHQPELNAPQLLRIFMYLILSSTHFDSFASTIVLVSISKKTGLSSISPTCPKR